MRFPLRTSAVAAGSLAIVASLLACGSSPTDRSSATDGQTLAPPGALAVFSNNNTSFDATYTLGDVWARARIEYTPATTFYEIITSHRTTIVRTGTALDARHQTTRLDPRVVDEVTRLSPSDSEYTIVAGFLKALLAAGATPRPSATEVGSTMYAATYFVAKAVGEVPASSAPARDRAATSPLSLAVWPYPGYYRKGDLPTELLPNAGQQNGNGLITCCGPYTCYDADWTSDINCDDWCAAGDACNAWGWGDCGTANINPPGGCNSCPHSDSPTLLSYDPSGCNNGSCSPSCQDQQPTPGPAANFADYGRVFFGAAGGEYGTGTDDYCCF
jgi:hypothetical protein